MKQSLRDGKEASPTIAPADCLVFPGHGTDRAWWMSIFSLSGESLAEGLGRPRQQFSGQSTREERVVQRWRTLVTHRLSLSFQLSTGQHTCVRRLIKSTERPRQGLEGTEFCAHTRQGCCQYPSWTRKLHNSQGLG